MADTVQDPAKARRHRNERLAAAALIVLLAAITAGIWFWKEREGERLRRDQRYIPKAVAITPEMELLREYLRIDTSTPAGVARGARWLVDTFAKSGVEAELIESTPGRFNVYARVRGASADGALLLYNHIDVIPVGAGWKQPAFEAKVVIDTLYGRGALDMKALAICQLLAFIDVAKSATPPTHDLVFLATADEETGSEHGMQWLIAHRPDIFRGVEVALTEGGITEMISEKMTYFGIEVGGKQMVSLTLEGDDLDSMRRARIALEPYIFPREAERVLPAVRRYFESVAPTRLAFDDYLSDIDATIARGAFWRLPLSYRDLTQNSLRVDAPRQHGGVWRMEVQQLNLPDERPEARIEWLRERIAPFGIRIAAVGKKDGPVPVSSDQTPLFALLVGEAQRRYAVPAGVIVLYRSTSDARFLRPLGIDSYGISPYPVPYFQSLGIHGDDERIRLDYFQEGTEYLRTVVRNWAGTATDN